MSWHGSFKDCVGGTAAVPFVSGRVLLIQWVHKKNKVITSGQPVEADARARVGLNLRRPGKPLVVQKHLIIEQLLGLHFVYGSAA